MSDINWHERAEQTEFNVRNFIDGEYQDCVGTTTIEKYAPNNGKLLYSFAAGDGSEVNQAVAAAKRTYKEGVWSNLSNGERKAVISKLADLVEEKAEKADHKEYHHLLKVLKEKDKINLKYSNQIICTKR